jgi:tRNA (mo5U34)-methyltransferase
MSRLEHRIKRLFNRVGFEIVRVNQPHAARLPVPSPAIVERAAAYFADTFPLNPALELSDQELAQQLQQFEWFYPFRFGDHHVGPNRQLPSTERGSYRRYLHIFSALLSLTGGSLANMRVLDSGCNAGFFSLQARRAGAAQVLGIDASPTNVAQATFITRITGIDGITYQVLNIYDLAPERLGTFDVTFFFGLLYHLDNPIGALTQLYAVTNKYAVIDTQLTNYAGAMLRIERDDAELYHPGSHTNRIAFVPSERAVVALLQSVGFRQVYMVPPTIPKIPDIYFNDRWGTFIAVK